MKYNENSKKLVYSEEDNYGANTRMYQEIKKDYKECKHKVSRLEWFLENIAKSFTSEYGY